MKSSDIFGLLFWPYCPYPIQSVFFSMRKTGLDSNIINPHNFALPVEYHILCVQNWHTGMTRSIGIFSEDQSTFEP